MKILKSIISRITMRKVGVTISVNGDFNYIWRDIFGDEYVAKHIFSIRYKI